MSEQLQIAIVGGGIGGLTAALALRARGFNVTVFEQGSVLREIGAGVSIHPNAALLLQRVGLTDGIKKIGSAVTGLQLRTSLGELINTSARTSTGVQGCGRHDKGSSVAAFQLSPCHRKHNLPDQLRVRPSSDRSGIA
jgi:salicylate hydroxylase